MMCHKEHLISIKGSKGSGGWGHAGRPKKHGGSLADSGGLRKIGASSGSSISERRELASKKPAPRKTPAKKVKPAPKKAESGGLTPAMAKMNQQDFNAHLMQSVQSGKLNMQDAQKLNHQYSDKATRDAAKRRIPEKRASAKTKKAPKPKKKDEQDPGFRSKKMKAFEESIAANKKESAAVFDKEGKELFRTSGKETEVTFTDAQLSRMKGAVVTHNHPDVVGGKKFPDGGSFSESDLQLINRTGASEVRAITKNYIYRMKPQMAGGRSFSGNAQFVADGKKAKVKSALDAKVKAGKLTRRQAAVDYMHEVWKQVADEGLIEYERIPR